MPRRETKTLKASPKMYKTLLILSAALVANALPTTPSAFLQTLGNLYIQHQTTSFSPQQPLLSTPQSHPSGTILMKSTLGDITALTFITSPKTCTPLRDEIEGLIDELGYNVLEDYPDGVHPPSGFSGRVTLDILESIRFLEYGREYGASIELSVSDSVNAQKWKELIALLGRTAMAIDQEREDIGLVRGAGRMGVEVKLGEVDVKAWWTFYKVVDGVAVECNKGEERWDLNEVAVIEDQERHGDL